MRTVSNAVHNLAEVRITRTSDEEMLLMAHKRNEPKLKEIFHKTVASVCFTDF